MNEFFLSVSFVFSLLLWGSGPASAYWGMQPQGYPQQALYPSPMSNSPSPNLYGAYGGMSSGSNIHGSMPQPSHSHTPNGKPPNMMSRQSQPSTTFGSPYVHTAPSFYGPPPLLTMQNQNQPSQLTNDPQLSAQLEKLEIVPPQVRVPKTYGVQELDYDDRAESRLIAIKFAPLILFHPDETYFPCSVEWFATQCDLYEGGYNRPRRIKHIETPSELRDYQSRRGYFLKPSLKDRDEKEFYKGEPLHGEDGKHSTAPVYVNFVEKDRDHAVIQYWFLYAYNGPTKTHQERGVGIHEGDWEHIDVHLVREKNRFRVEKIFYGAHQGNYQGRFMGPGEIIYYKGSHPVVFAAKYSHTSLPRSAPPHTGRSPQLDEARVGHVHWPTYNTVIMVGSKKHPERGQDWIQFNGRWGGFGSPKTPSYQRYWHNAGREDYHFVPLPPEIVFDATGRTPHFSLRGLVPLRSVKVCFKADSPRPFTYWVMERSQRGEDKAVYGPLHSREFVCRDWSPSKTSVDVSRRDRYHRPMIHRGLYFKSDNPTASRGVRPKVLAPQA